MAKYTLNKLRPSAVIMAAKFLKNKKDEWETACYVQKYLSANGHKLNVNNLWIHLVVIEALQTPIFPCKQEYKTQY